MGSSILRHDTQCGESDESVAVESVINWFLSNARNLPWRSDDRTPWGVLVSEVMLQQTQVSRVEPRWHAWMQRWPTPQRLAAAPVAAVIEEWQGLGYPRRALRLRQAAESITSAHDGQVPRNRAQLEALPGVGEYTAAAVLAFAFGERVSVLDTNVRRVLARWLSGTAAPASSAPTSSERRLAEGLLPQGELAPLWSVAVMELGALVCSARAPRCDECPLSAHCNWLATGRPAGRPATSRAPFSGSDRQARGVLLRFVTEHGPIPDDLLMDQWHIRRAGDASARDQARRAVDSLIGDGLLQRHGWLVSLPAD